MQDSINISNAEWCVMRIVWTLKECTSRDIIDQLAIKNDWKPSTVKTLITRLKKKAYLSAHRSGNAFVYTPAITEKKAMNASTIDLFNNMCEMRVGMEVGNVIDHFAISKGDIQKLIDQLKQKQLTAPDQVKCNCVADQHRMCKED